MENNSCILIVDYNIGNASSITNMVQHLGSKSILTKDIKIIKNAKKIILPGVGSFDAAMEMLSEYNLIDALKEAVNNGAYLLGICLGAQLLLESSEEGRLPGLGFIKGKVKKFKVDELNLRVPHMGWNNIKPSKDNSLLNTEDKSSARFYFAHTYYISCEDTSDISATCKYGHEFTCGIERGKIMGVQFHPEKSHRFGMELFKKFIELPC